MALYMFGLALQYLYQMMQSELYYRTASVIIYCSTNVCVTDIFMCIDFIFSSRTLRALVPNG